MSLPDPTAFLLLRPPYRECHPYETDEPSRRYSSELRGVALIWSLSRGRVTSGIDLAINRPPGVPLILILPELAGRARVEDRVLEALEATRPHSVLPYHSLQDPQPIARLLGREPHRLPDEFVDFLTWRGLSLDRETRRIVRRTVELALQLSTLDALSRRVYLSRRALGRRFHRLGLPVPSHWLQLARLLWASVRLQGCRTSISQLARSLGYPNGFTLSNQMERVIGVRPSIVRKRLGWEWIVEEWLRKEWVFNGLRGTLPGIEPGLHAPDQIRAARLEKSPRTPSAQAESRRGTTLYAFPAENPRAPEGTH